MPLGKVKWFNEIRGTGVVRRLQRGEFPLHFAEILGDGFRTLHEGEMVEFELEVGSRGPQAVRVRRLDEGELRV